MPPVPAPKSDLEPIASPTPGVHAPVQPARSSPLKRAWPWASVILLLGLALGWVLLSDRFVSRQDSRLTGSTAAVQENAVSVQAPLPAPNPREIFEQRVRPVVVASVGRQALAIEQTLELLRAEFRGVHAGVEPFAEGLTSPLTQLRVILRMAGEQIGAPGQVQELIAERFEQHIFRASELQEWIDSALIHASNGFTKEVNLMLRDVHEVVTGAGLPRLELPDTDELLQASSAALRDQAVGAARDSAFAGLGTLVLGTLAGEVAQALATRAALGIGGRAAAGATAGGASAGWVGPVAGGLGFIAGLSAGLAVDWYLREHSQAEIESDLHRLLDGIEAALIEGDALRPGLGPLLRAHAERLQAAQVELLEQLIVRP
jgi:hypothetical protein